MEAEGWARILTLDSERLRQEGKRGNVSGKGKQEGDQEKCETGVSWRRSPEEEPGQVDGWEMDFPFILWFSWQGSSERRPSPGGP